METKSPSPQGLRPATYTKIIGGLSVVLALSLILPSLVGATDLDLSRALRGDDTFNDAYKLWALRMPRALAAVVIGSALAVAGVLFQALVHNPLASPYILGVSAGGSLGAAWALALGLGALLTVPAAFAGALLSIALVWAISQREGSVRADTLLLSGVIVNTFLSAAILFITYTTQSDRSLVIMRWLVGGIPDLIPSEYLLASGIIAVLLFIPLLFQGRTLNLLSQSDDLAERLGVPVARTRLRLFLTASLLTAAAVSISGPIGFIGLIVPHLLRLLVGGDHRLLIPASALVGGAFLIVCDVLAGVIYHVPLPVGLLTAFVGGPFFILLMKTRDIHRSGHAS